MTTRIYSALYGDVDHVPTLPPDLPCEAIMYTDDRHLVAPGWEIRYVPHGIWSPTSDPVKGPPMLAHKYWKLFAGHNEPGWEEGEADIAIWLDASVTIALSGEEFVKRCVDAVGSDDMAFVKHPWRAGIYDEAAYSALLPRYAYEAPHILAQSAYYDTIGHPDHWGLMATGFMVRKNNTYVRKLMEDWWYEILHRSHQDQVSLPVLLWLAEGYLKWNTKLPGHMGSNGFQATGGWTELSFHKKWG